MSEDARPIAPGPVCSILVEALIALAALAAVLWSTSGVDVDALDRIGQVSLLAAVQLRVTFVALVVIAVFVGLRAMPRTAPWSNLVLWGSVPALATGFLASAIMITMQGTVWPIGGDVGDIGTVRSWIIGRQNGTSSIPAGYPPVFPFVADYISRLTHAEPAWVLHEAQIYLTAIMGPVAYFAWRTMLNPMWAAVFAVIASANFVEPYKPYAAIALVILLPLLAAYVRATRLVPERRTRSNVLVAAALGASLGAMTIVYSGWLFWIAPGIFVLLVAVTAWRRALGKVLAFHGVAFVAFLVVSARYLWTFASSPEEIKDTYFYFDTYVDPAYIAMWRGGQEGYTGPWPIPGELGGVGLFSILLLLGVGAAVALALRRSVVLTACAMFLSSWLLRFSVASHMWEDQAVQLYPRTTYTIYLAALVLVLFVIYHLLAPRISRALPLRPVAVPLGVFITVALIGTTAASATADRYMPRNDLTIGGLAWKAYTLRNPDGTCPKYVAANAECKALVAPPADDAAK